MDDHINIKDGLGNRGQSQSNSKNYNHKRFVAETKRQNEEKDAEEQRLIASLGLTENDLIDRDDPDLGSTRSAEAMLRSIERQKEYKKRKIEEAKKKKGLGTDIVEDQKSYDNKSIERTLKYRCEQMSVTRLNGVMVNSTQIKRDFLVTENTDNVSGVFAVKMQDNIVNASPQSLKDAVGLLMELDNTMCSNVVLTVDAHSGKIATIQNHNDIISGWNTCKASMKDKYSFLRSNDTREKLEEFFHIADEQICNQEHLKRMLCSKLFYDVFFDRYLVTNENLYDPYERTFNSQLFEGLQVQLDFNQKIQKESPDMVFVRKTGKTNKDKLDLSAIEKLYERKFQPAIQYKFSDYNYSIRESCVFNTKKKWIVQSEISMVEEISNNIEVIIDYKLRKIV